MIANTRTKKKSIRKVNKGKLIYICTSLQSWKTVMPMAKVYSVRKRGLDILNQSQTTCESPSLKYPQQGDNGREQHITSSVILFLMLKTNLWMMKDPKIKLWLFFSSLRRTCWSPREGKHSICKRYKVISLPLLPWHLKTRSVHNFSRIKNLVA